MLLKIYLHIQRNIRILHNICENDEMENKTTDRIIARINYDIILKTLLNQINYIIFLSQMIYSDQSHREKIKTSKSIKIMN